MRARSVTLIALLAVLGAALAGCLEETAPGAGAGPGDQTPPVTTNTDDGLELTVAANRSAVSPGEALNVTFNATNVGGEPVTYRKGCFHEWDVRVLNESGEEVPAMRPMAMCLGFQETELAPGENATAWAHWNGTLWTGDGFKAAPAGDYTVEVTFTAFEQESDERLNVTAGVVVQVTEGSLNGSGAGGDDGREGGSDGDGAPSNGDAAGDNGIVLRADAEPATVQPGGRVNVTFTATNLGPGAVTWREGCLQSWEFKVVAPNGTDVTPGVFTCEGFQEAQLAEGGEANATYPWDATVDGAPAPEGRYTIVGAFLFNDGDGWTRVVERATVRVAN